MEGDEDVPLPGMEWVSDHPVVTRSCVEIRVGQVWSFAHRRDRLYEIIGFAAGDIVLLIVCRPGRHAGVPTGPMAIGGSVHIDEDNFCLGRVVACQWKFQRFCTNWAASQSWFSSQKRGMRKRGRHPAPSLGCVCGWNSMEFPTHELY